MDMLPEKSVVVSTAATVKYMSASKQNFPSFYMCALFTRNAIGRYIVSGTLRFHGMQLTELQLQIPTGI